VVFCAALDQLGDISHHKNHDDSGNGDNIDNSDKAQRSSGLRESLSYFEHLLQLPLYGCYYVVLLFERSGIGFSNFRSAFPDYPGLTLASNAIQLIKDKFEGLVRQSPVPRPIYITSAQSHIQNSGGFSFCAFKIKCVTRTSLSLVYNLESTP